MEETEKRTDEAPAAGMLYVVSTPIGNLEDLSLRAIRILGEVDIIAAEDTRQTLKLLNHLGIKKPMISFHEHNKFGRGGLLIEKLLQGNRIAIVSDAGTPCISDPGENLISLAAEHGIGVTAIPGPTAAITGLVLSGLPTGRFVFEGFLPVNKRARREKLEALKTEERTIVLYEAPHKLPYTLDDILAVLGNRRMAMARELTKKFEEVLRCTVSEAVEFCKRQVPRGEYVLVLSGADPKAAECEKTANTACPSSDPGLAEQLGQYMGRGLSKKEAIRMIARDRGVSRREIYNALMKQK